MTFFISVEEDFTVRNSFKPCLQLSFKVQLQTLETLFWSELSQSRDLLGERMCLDNWKTISALHGSLAESQSTLEMGRRENKTRDPSTTTSSEKEPVQVAAASELPVRETQQLACSWTQDQEPNS